MSDLNDNREGGLFSDDYEIPKRENPYKKKKQKPAPEERTDGESSEEYMPAEEKRENPYKRAPRASKKEKFHGDTDGEAPPVDEMRAYQDSEGTHLPKEEKSIGERWNDFIFNHVKLICFIGGVIVLLLFISAPAIYYGIQDAREAAEIAAKDPLTMTYIQGLADKSEPIQWRDLVSFRYDETKTSDSVTWMLPVENSHYEVWISGVNTQSLPVYVRLYNMRTGDMVDLREGSAALDAFLRAED